MLQNLFPISLGSHPLSSLEKRCNFLPFADERGVQVTCGACSAGYPLRYPISCPSLFPLPTYTSHPHYSRIPTVPLQPGGSSQWVSPAYSCGSRQNFQTFQTKTGANNHTKAAQTYTAYIGSALLAMNETKILFDFCASA